VYVGEYRLGSGSASLEREYIMKLAEFAAQTRIGGELLTPDASVAEFLRSAGDKGRQVAPINADGIGRIGLRKLLAGDVADAASVDVNYIRRSDAEIFSATQR
jgi:hypothetical protein